MSTRWPRLDAALVAQRLERGDAGGRDRGRLLERQGGGFRDQHALRRADVLGAGSALLAEHLVARLEAGHILPDRLDPAGEIDAGDVALGLAPTGGSPCEVGVASEQMPVERIHRRGADPNEDLVVGRYRFRDVLECEDIGRAVAVIRDRIHRLESPGVGRQ